MKLTANKINPLMSFKTVVLATSVALLAISASGQFIPGQSSSYSIVSQLNQIQSILVALMTSLGPYTTGLSTAPAVSRKRQSIVRSSDHCRLVEDQHSPHLDSFPDNYDRPVPYGYHLHPRNSRIRSWSYQRCQLPGHWWSSDWLMNVILTLLIKFPH